MCGNNKNANDSQNSQYLPVDQVLNIEVNSVFAGSLRGYITLNDGWIAPFNGYQYKVTSTRQDWQASRQTCRGWGGDLAVYGVIDMGVRG